MSWLFPTRRKESADVHHRLKCSQDDLDVALTRHQSTAARATMKADDSRESATMTALRTEQQRQAVEDLLAAVERRRREKRDADRS